MALDFEKMMKQARLKSNGDNNKKNNSNNTISTKSRGSDGKNAENLDEFDEFDFDAHGNEWEEEYEVNKREIQKKSQNQV